MNLRTGQQTPERTNSGGTDAPEIFVSPRVVDRRAFSELAGELRALVEQASAERAALTAGLDQAGRATDDFRSREAAQAMNIELCSRALKKIDEKISRAESLLSQAANAGAIVEQIEARSSSIVDAKADVLEARVQAIQAGATSHAEALEERLKRATRELEQRIEAVRRDAESIAAPSAQNLKALCDRAALILGREPGQIGPMTSGSLGDLLSKAQTMTGQTTETVEHLQRASVIADEHRAGIDAWFVDMHGKLAEFDERQRAVGSTAHGLSELVGRALSELDIRITSQRVAAAEIGAIVDRETARANEQTQAAVEAMRASLETVRQTREAALVELKPEADSIIAQVKDAVKQAQDMHNTTGLALRLLEKASAQANGVMTQLKPWEGLLTSDGTSGLPAPIQRMVDAVRGGMQDELSSIADALRQAAAKADRTANRVLLAPADQADEPQSPVVVRRFSEHVQSAD